MSKIKNMSETNFLKLLFAFLSLSTIVYAFFMPDRSNMISGLWEIVSNPIKQPSNSFAIGGFAGTFLSVGLVCLAFTVLACVLPKINLNAVSTLGFILTMGFAFWGVNIINIWPATIGCALYAIVKKQPISSQFNAMMFCTGVTPIFSELLLRYPNEEIRFSVSGFILFMVTGILVGFFMPAGLGHAPNVHKGFDLYSAAVHVGFSACLLYGIFYKTIGVAVPESVGADMIVQNYYITNTYCSLLFGGVILLALFAGCTVTEYMEMLTDPVHVTDVAAKYGNPVMLMNFGVYGLCIMVYYNIVQVQFNAAIVGIIFCMLCTCNSGTTPRNVWPVIFGYAIGAFGFGCISYVMGTEFTGTMNSQAIAIGLCFANGLTPIGAKYGRFWIVIASFVHYCLVTTIPNLYGGMCLYNGGLTAALTCLIVIPQMEQLCKIKERFLQAQAGK